MSSSDGVSTSSTMRCSTRPLLVMTTRSTRAFSSGTISMWRTVERVSDGYCTMATWLVSCARTRTVRCTVSSTSIAPVRKVSMARRSAAVSALTVARRSTNIR
jgi:hypothetical protein